MISNGSVDRRLLTSLSRTTWISRHQKG